MPANATWLTAGQPQLLDGLPVRLLRPAELPRRPQLLDQPPERLDLDGKEVSLDALHTQAETARALVLEHGADYGLTVKGNQPTVQENIGRHVATPPGAFPP